MTVVVSLRKQMKKCAIVLLCMLLIIGCLYGIRHAVATSAPAGVRVPILMYHGFSEDKKHQGQYVIPPSVLESDLTYLTEHGYTTVTMQDLIDHVDRKTPLPEKPIVLTFDDGYYNNYVYAFPLVRKYGCKMVLSPIGAAVDEYTKNQNTNVEYATCHWEHLQEMAASGAVEIQNHSYAMHSLEKRNGTKQLPSETKEQYRMALENDIGKMQELCRRHLGAVPTTFTYPFGAITPSSAAILKEMGFRATLTCEGRMNRITTDPACLFGLGRYIRTADESTASFFAKIK